MRHQQRWVVALLVAATITAAGTIASAQKEATKDADPFQSLNLSDDQKTKLDKASLERAMALNANQQKIAGIRDKLRGLLVDKKASDKEIDKAADQLVSANKEALLAEIRFHKTLRQVLTQEQLTAISKGGR